MKELTDALKKEKKIIFGTDRTMKLLKNKKLSKVFIASNCKDKEDFEHYCKINETELIELDMKNKEVGVFCKKLFFISAVGLEK
ncbi:MAG: hypothetical protein CMH64_04690 [Nanoarchaeota archaeon]|nr:hypothetical protein [Nanoarchaeota archaeon]|tara:strand:- start:418 stop:669 length:252 start_codon:yes stop_codon:yes gene_type:complete